MQSKNLTNTVQLHYIYNTNLIHSTSQATISRPMIACFPATINKWSFLNLPSLQKSNVFTGLRIFWIDYIHKFTSLFTVSSIRYEAELILCPCIAFEVSEFVVLFGFF